MERSWRINEVVFNSYCIFKMVFFFIKVIDSERRIIEITGRVVEKENWRREENLNLIWGVGKNKEREGRIRKRKDKGNITRRGKNNRRIEFKKDKRRGRDN